MGARIDGACRVRRGGPVQLAIMPVAWVLLANSSPTWASPCDDYRSVLAERFEAAGVRGYSLEIVPASAAVPPGTKVIATCEGGARKFLYRRWAAGAPPSGAAPVASGAPRAAVGEAPARQAAPVLREAQGATALPASTPAPMPAPMRVPGAKAAKSAPASAVGAASAPGPASTAAATRPIEATVAVPPTRTPTDASAVTDVTPQQGAAAFAARQWPWIGALALGTLVAGLWFWRTRFSAYDRDGLPRGPRL